MGFDACTVLCRVNVHVFMRCLGTNPSAGADHAILAQRHALYCQARERNPRRWSGKTRDWTPIGAVTLNPERDAVVNTHGEGIDI